MKKHYSHSTTDDKQVTHTHTQHSTYQTQTLRMYVEYTCQTMSISMSCCSVWHTLSQSCQRL